MSVDENDRATRDIFSLLAAPESLDINKVDKMGTKITSSTLTLEQELFSVWVQGAAPYLLPLFDFNKAVYLPEVVDEYLSVASSGRALMARFVLGVWLHNDEFGFDFVEAAKTLDDQHMKVITDWLTTPHWP